MFRLMPLVLAVTMLAFPSHSATLTDAHFQEIAQEIFRPAIQENDLPGLAVGVTIDGEHYFYVDGLAVRKGELPVTKDTIFELGSVSKLFTVALAGLGETRGLLALDAPVSKEFPALVGSAFDRITLYDLAANATGSLPLQVPDSIKNNRDLINYLKGWKPAADPKSVRAYSNVSAGLLGLIAGERFGATYERAVQEHLFTGLHLTSTFIKVPKAAMPRYAFGYNDAQRAIRVNPGVLDSEAYGVKSTAADMTRFLDAHLGTIKIKPEFADALAKTRMVEFQTSKFQQAMIWEAYPWPADTAQVMAGHAPDMAMKANPMTHHGKTNVDATSYFSKTGSTNGFGAYVAIVPSKRIGVVVLANRWYPNPTRASITLNLINTLIRQKSD